MSTDIFGVNIYDIRHWIADGDVQRVNIFLERFARHFAEFHETVQPELTPTIFMEDMSTNAAFAPTLAHILTNVIIFHDIRDDYCFVIGGKYIASKHILIDDVNLANQTDPERPTFMTERCYREFLATKDCKFLSEMYTLSMYPHVFIDRLERVKGPNEMKLRAIMKSLMMYDAREWLRGISYKAALTLAKKDGIVTFTHYAASLLTSKHIISVLIHGCGSMCTSNEAAFICAYEIMIRKIPFEYDGTFLTFMITKNYKIRASLDTIDYPFRRAFYELCGGPPVDFVSSLAIKSIEVTTELPLWTDEMVTAILNTPHVWFTVRDRMKETLHHYFPHIVPKPVKKRRSLAEHPLKYITEESWRRMISDAEIIEMFSGDFISCKLMGILCQKRMFMSDWVFRWYMRTLIPMYNVDLTGHVKFRRIFVNDWGKDMRRLGCDVVIVCNQ